MRRLNRLEEFDWPVFLAAVGEYIDKTTRVDAKDRRRMHGVMEFLGENIEPKLFLRTIRKTGIKFGLSGGGKELNTLFWEDLDRVVENNTAGRNLKKSVLMRHLHNDQVKEELFFLLYAILVDVFYVELYSHRELVQLCYIKKVYDILSLDFYEKFLDIYDIIDIQSSFEHLRTYVETQIVEMQESTLKWWLGARAGYVFTPHEMELIEAAKLNLANGAKRCPVPELVIFKELIFSIL